MKNPVVVVLLLLLLFVCTTGLIAQGIPGDPDHLPKMIGGESSINSRTDSLTVSGKVTISGLPSDQTRPQLFVAVYKYGRFVIRRPVSNNGSYSIGDVPREGSTLILEVDQLEIETRQIFPSPAMMIFQDFNINLTQITAASSKMGRPSSVAAYERSKKSQELFERSSAEINKGKTDSAVALLKTVLDEDPKDHYAWTMLANAYFLKKDHAKAESAYSNALNLAPTSYLPLINLGKLYLLQEKYELAIDVLAKAVNVQPTSADAQQLLGEAYLAIKKGSKAVVYLNEAIRLAPIEKAEVHLRLATLFNAAGLKAKASAEYQKFLEKVPKYDRRDQLKKYIAENPPVQ